jgi:hypothetical protein
MQRKTIVRYHPKALRMTTLETTTTTLSPSHKIYQYGPGFGLIGTLVPIVGGNVK